MLQAGCLVRKTLNDNPLIAIAVVAVLGIGVAFMLMGQLSKGSGSSASSTTAVPDTGATVPATGTATPAVTDPAATASAPAATPTSAPPADFGAFEPGPGLPKAVVDAYKRGDVVALLVLKRNGIDDRAVQAAVNRIQKAANVAVFQTYAQGVARYSRIAEGVDLNRVPAMVVIRPRSSARARRPPPSATASAARPASPRRSATRPTRARISCRSTPAESSSTLRG